MLVSLARAQVTLDWSTEGSVSGQYHAIITSTTGAQNRLCYMHDEKLNRPRAY
jgi:hypothetical protein